MCWGAPVQWYSIGTPDLLIVSIGGKRGVWWEVGAGGVPKAG